MGRKLSKEEKEHEQRLQQELQAKLDMKYMKEAMKQARKAYALRAVSSYIRIRSSAGDTTGGRSIRIHWLTRNFRQSVRPAGR